VEETIRAGQRTALDWLRQAFGREEPRYGRGEETVLDPEMGATDPVGWLRGEWENMGVGEKIGTLAPLPSPAKATMALKALVPMATGGAVAGILKNDAMTMIRDLFKSKLTPQRAREYFQGLWSGGEKLSQDFWNTVDDVLFWPEWSAGYRRIGSIGELWLNPERLARTKSTNSYWLRSTLGHEVGGHGAQFFPERVGLNEQAQNALLTQSMVSRELYNKFGHNLVKVRDFWDMDPSEIQAKAIGTLVASSLWPKSPRLQKEIFEETIFPSGMDAIRNMRRYHPDWLQELKSSMPPGGY
jgi:hypothetical protein